MRRRWAIWVVGIGLLAAIALFPLRVALDMSDLKRMGFTARQVAGTIWYGRIGDLQLRSQPLGTFEVELDPLALLLGRVSMNFNRMEDPQGVLNGRLIAGLSRGAEDVNGRLEVGDMFAPLPVRALEFRNTSVRFRNGLCVEGKGQVTAIVATPIPGLDFSGVTGAISCDGERARVRMIGRASESMEFYVHSSGSYRGWISVRNPPPLAGAALGLLGFRPSPQGLTITVNGQL